MSLAANLKIDTNSIRTRSFEMNGQNFKVRVPLASEMEAITSRVDAVDTIGKEAEMLSPLIEKRETLEGDSFEFVEDGDVIVDGRSIRSLAQMSAQTEQRILEMIRLLVPADPAFDMASISYKDISDEFPFAIQMDLVKKITEVISPGYEESRKN